MGDESKRRVWTIAVCATCGEYQHYGRATDGGYYCAACQDRNDARLVEVVEVQAERDGSARKTDSWYAGFDAGFQRGQEAGREAHAAELERLREAARRGLEALDDAITHNVNATEHDPAGWTQENYDAWDAARRELAVTLGLRVITFAKGDDWENRVELAENVEALADALGHLERALNSKSHTVQVMPGRWEILDEIGVRERTIYVQLKASNKDTAAAFQAGYERAVKKGRPYVEEYKAATADLINEKRRLLARARRIQKALDDLIETEAACRTTETPLNLIHAAQRARVVLMTDAFNPPLPD